MGTRMDDIIPISICIPCYNNPAGVKKLLDSILSQTFGTFECIITDDSADDRTKEVVKPFLADGRFTYVHNAKALGSPENWNYCASLAKGAYIKIMQHQLMVQYTHRPAAALVRSGKSACWSYTVSR